jgi:Bcr/CflA subfamily drug resistance transporter
MEWTLTVYLLGFALGSLFWGIVSDKYGRKVCMILGLSVYVFGCIACASSGTVITLMVGRLFQSFGVAVGVIISQSMVRDTLSGKELAKAYSLIGTSLAFFPAIGPLIGSLIIRYYEWHIIFVVLSCFGILFLILASLILPETHLAEKRAKKILIIPVIKRMVRDWNVIIACLTIGLTQGITFSYYAEAPFYFTNLLGISVHQYSTTMLVIMFGFATGGFVSNRLSGKFETKSILKYAIFTQLILISTFFSGTVILSKLNFHDHTNLFFVLLMIALRSGVNAVIMSQSLTIALTNFRDVIGTAGAILNCSYFIIISFCTFIMGFIHDDFLTTMPLYFLILCVLTSILFRLYIRKTSDLEEKKLNV